MYQTHETIRREKFLYSIQSKGSMYLDILNYAEWMWVADLIIEGNDNLKFSPDHENTYEPLVNELREIAQFIMGEGDGPIEKIETNKTMAIYDRVEGKPVLIREHLKIVWLYLWEGKRWRKIPLNKGSTIDSARKRAREILSPGYEPQKDITILDRGKFNREHIYEVQIGPHRCQVFIGRDGQGWLLVKEGHEDNVLIFERPTSYKENLSLARDEICRHSLLGRGIFPYAHMETHGV